jgi:hypothetical protein
MILWHIRQEACLQGADFTGQTFTWTPGYDQSGAYSVTFTADDGQAQDSQTINITVANNNRLPVISNASDKTVDENTELTFSLTASDPDGDTVTLSATGLPLCRRCIQM